MGECRAVSADRVAAVQRHVTVDRRRGSGSSSPAWIRANLACNTASAASVRAILATPTAATASRSAWAAA